MDVLGFGGPSGNDHGSSNWAAWGHPEIRSMLDTSVDPGDLHEAARVWRKQGRHADELVSGLTRDLNGIVSGGWRGAAADAATTALGPINQWSASMADTAQHTTMLLDAAGSSTAQAKAAVPPPKSHDWGESLRSFATGGVLGAVVDAVAQEREQSAAHAEAVRIMTNVYSASINDYRAAVPTYPQLVDPTLTPPQQPPNTSPAPGYPRAGTGTPGDGHVVGYPPLALSARTRSAPSAHPRSAPTAGTQPAPVALQGVTSTVPAPHGVDQVAADQGIPEPLQGAAPAVGAPAGVPVREQAAGEARRARAAGGGIWLDGGQGSGGGRLGVARPAEFGPRPSARTEDARMGAGLGRGATGMGAERAYPGGMMAPMGVGLGKGGEDAEHRRPSYLIEVDDVFSDHRKVAPAVIGEDLPDQDD